MQAQPFLTLPVGTYLWRVIKDAALARGARLLPHLELSSFSTVLAQVAAGVGVSIVPALALAGEVRPRVQTAAVRQPAPRRGGCPGCAGRLAVGRLPPAGRRLCRPGAPRVLASRGAGLAAGHLRRAMCILYGCLVWLPPGDEDKPASCCEEVGCCLVSGLCCGLRWLPNVAHGPRCNPLTSSSSPGRTFDVRDHIQV